MNIRFQTIAKDEWLAGDYAICDKCHAHIRHIMFIDGIPHGLDCGATEAGWTTKRTKKIKSRLESYRYMMNECESIKRKYDNAHAIIRLLKLPIPFTTQEEVVRIVEGIVN